MVLCGRCGDEAQDCVQCNSCKKNFLFPCAGITERGYRNLGTERQAAWKCANCKCVTPKSTELFPAAEGAPQSKCDSPGPVTLERLMEELNQIKLTLAPLTGVKAGIEELKTEMTEMKSSFKDFSTKLTNLDDRLKRVEKVGDSVQELEVRISQLESDLNEKNQWARSNNIEIKGVPMKDRENLFEIVGKIGAKISYAVPKQSINFVTRVPSKDSRSKPIIVSFVNRYTKEDFVAAARTLNKLYPTDIGLEGTNQIYVNDHLTVQNKMLLTEAKKLKIKNQYDYVWVKNSKIFARKNAQSKVLSIKCQKDLEKMC